ncbi:thiolase domain-containing protein [Patescibacteria group bacterium]|nr:thiolase domain-containing protein [Patescibacteria group bacterium]
MYIIGTGLTKFGEHFEKSLLDLALEASVEAVKESGLELSQIDAVVVGNMLSDTLSSQGHLGALLSSSLGLNVEAFRVEAACASGGVAFKKGVDMLKAGQYQNILVVGAEKMCDHKSSEVVAGLTNAAHAEKESFYGLTFPSVYALMTQRYFYQYSIASKELAAVAVKNHYHGARNNKAHFPKEITIDTVLKSSVVAEPLTLFDCSPISDGAAAVVLSLEAKPEAVKVLSSEIATDSVALQDRQKITSIKATKIAAKKAYKNADVTIKDIDMLEVHDCFTIAEVIALEDLGFYKEGQAGQAAKLGHTYYNAKLPVNTSGGLKSAGHPVGATGVKQVIEIVHQLQGRAEGRQVNKAQLGLTHNVGGSGATAVVSILSSNI